METLDAEEYMDIITTYRCKFCDFTAPQAKDIALHVKAVHIKPRTIVLDSSEPQSATLSQETYGNQPHITVISSHGSEFTDTVQTQCNEKGIDTNTDVVLRAVKESNLNIQKEAGIENEAEIETEVPNSLEALIVDGGNDVDSVMTHYNGDGGQNGEIVSFVVDGQTYSVVGQGESAVTHTNNVQVLANNDADAYNLIYSEINNAGVNVTDTEIQQNTEATGNSNVHVLMNAEYGQENVEETENNVNEEVNEDKDIEYIIQEDAANASTYDTENTDTADPESEIDAEYTENPEYQQDNSNMHIFVENSADASIRKISIDTLKKALVANNVIPNDINSAEIEMELTAKNSVHVENVEEDSVMAAKELYLCGNCSAGFGNIQACKDHMLTEHGAYAVENSGAMSHNKVDACTQMAPKKKPGRKKKSEMRQANPDQEQEASEALSDSGSELDWTESLHVDYSRNTRSRRRRGPPAALKNDYYLGKKAKEKPAVAIVTPEDVDNEMRQPEETENPFRNWKKSLRFRCTVKGCAARFRDTEILKKHQDCHIRRAKKSEPAFRCLKCEERFKFWNQARYHMWKKHREDVGMMSCDVCDTFKTDMPSKLKTHLEVHSSDRPYVCPVCKKGFKQQSQMKNHVVIHKDVLTDVEGKWYASVSCDICGRTFSNSKCLKTHVNIVHGDAKPFKCTHCNHTCSRKAMMQLHMRIHTQEKPFKCDQCSFAANDHNSLRRHKMRHTGQRPYKCPHCPYACIQAISLKVHIKNKHPGQAGVYVCQLCFYKTLNQTLYEDHLRDHKNGLIETLNPPAQMTMKALKSRKQKPIINPQITNISSNLIKTHLEVHSSDRPYVCPVCKKGFKQQSQMKNHVVIHKDVLTDVEGKWCHLQGTSQPPSQIITLQGSSVNTPPSQPQIIQLPDNPQVRQVEMQVQTNADGQNIITEEELAKLNNFEGLVESDVEAARLIFSALNAMSQNTQQTMTRKTGAIVAELANSGIDNSAIVNHDVTGNSAIVHEMTNNGVIVQELHHTNTAM